jgi:hypothetical protein
VSGSADATACRIGCAILRPVARLAGVLSGSRIVASVATREHHVALTIDDGPHPATPRFPLPVHQTRPWSAAGSLHGTPRSVGRDLRGLPRSAGLRPSALRRARVLARIGTVWDGPRGTTPSVLRRGSLHGSSHLVGGPGRDFRPEGADRVRPR